MNKLVIILFIMLAACTTSEIPRNKDDVDKYYELLDGRKKTADRSKNRHGHIDYVTGRRAKNHADYYRLLITNGDKQYLTYYAYDCKLLNDDIIIVHTRYNHDIFQLFKSMGNIYGYVEVDISAYSPKKNGLESKGIVISSSISRFFYSSVKFDRKYVKHLTGEEVKQLLREHESNIYLLKSV